MSNNHVPSAPIKAIGHGRMLNLAELGVPAVLLFVGRETSSQASPVVNAIRERYPTVGEVMICNIADVRGIPKLVRKPVEMLMKSSYKDAVDNLQEGRTAEDYVLILPDWDGGVYEAAGIQDVSKEVALAVIDPQGRVVGTHQGEGVADRAVELLDGLISST